MKFLFQANTVYQLLVILTIKMRLFPDTDADFILSDIMNDVDIIAERIRQKKICDKVLIQRIKGKELSKRKRVFLLPSEKKKNVFIEGDLNKDYTDFFFCNPSIFNITIYELINKHNCKMHIFEDGLATYSKHYLDLYNPKGLKKIIEKRWKMKYAKDIYMFLPELFDWNTKRTIITIPKLNGFDSDQLAIINYIFGYEKSVLPNDCKTIFFEEGYYGDGKKTNDEEIIYKCIEKFGIEGFYIKNHPRNKINRFANRIKCFPSMSIPWELFVMNNMEKIKDLTLISIASAALFTPTILFDIKPKCYYLVDMINDEKILYPYIPDIERKISKLYNNFVLFDDVEMEAIIK